MSFLDELDELKTVEYITFNFPDGITLKIYNATPQICRDFFYYNKQAQKKDIAKWFYNRKCDIHFINEVQKDDEEKIITLLRYLCVSAAVWILNKEFSRE